MRLVLILLLSSLMVGCATGARASSLDFIVNDLGAAQSNLQAAADAGQLAKDDPALVCLNGVMAQLNTPNVPLKVNGLVSMASVAYIKAQKLKQGGPVVQKDCNALVGEFLLEGAKAALPIKLP